MEFVSTKEFAAAVPPNGVTTSAIYKAFAARGHYADIKPTKGANGRLLWPADAVTRLRGGQHE